MTDDLRRALEEYFRGRALPEIIAAYLFGSRARGAGARESDVDVGLVLDPTLPYDSAARFELRLRLIGEIIHVLGVNEVDVVILNEAPPPLAAKIIREGIPVHRSRPELVRAVERDVQLRAADLLPFLQRMRRLQLDRLV